MIDKEFLIHKAHYNKLLTNYYPSQFYSLTEPDLTLTKENKLKPTANLSRDIEGVISTDKSPMFTFSIDTFAELFEKGLYDSCYELIRICLDNVLTYYSTACIPTKEKIENLYLRNKLKYATMGCCLRVLDLLDNRVGRYKVKQNMDTIFTSTEVFYKRTERIDIDESMVIL
jgi:hypothetical protein